MSADMLTWRRFNIDDVIVLAPVEELHVCDHTFHPADDALLLIDVTEINHHKAEPKDGTSGPTLCQHCDMVIEQVPGGRGPTWVHASTGAVAGSGRPRS